MDRKSILGQQTGSGRMSSSEAEAGGAETETPLT